MQDNADISSQRCIAIETAAANQQVQSELAAQVHHTESFDFIAASQVGSFARCRLRMHDALLDLMDDAAGVD